MYLFRFKDNEQKNTKLCKICPLNSSHLKDSALLGWKCPILHLASKDPNLLTSAHCALDCETLATASDMGAVSGYLGSFGRHLHVYELSWALSIFLCHHALMSQLINKEYSFTDAQTHQWTTSSTVFRYQNLGLIKNKFCLFCIPNVKHYISLKSLVSFKNIISIKSMFCA